jgi:putative endonuclease
VEAGPRVRRGPGVLAQARGNDGEDAAVKYLEGLGHVILDRNFRTPKGEIDIVARDQSTTIFVEVKRREATGHGSAAEFVSPQKMRKVVSAARIYAARHGLTDRLIRFDVIAIDVIDGREQLRHHKGAFDAR